MEQNEESDKKLISSIINEEILNKLEKSVETMEPVASALASEDYKINILVTTICHGEKIILRPLVSFDDFVDNYMRELARQSWYPFVRKTYKYGYAPFGNACIFRATPTDPWSNIDKKKNIEEYVRSNPRPNFRSRIDAASISGQFYSKYINEPANGKLTEAEIEGKKRGAIMGKMVKTFSNMDPHEFPVKALMNPLKMRLEVIPSVYSLSGKNTDRQEEEFQKVPNFFGISRDFYSGIFTSILSDNRDNVFTFSSLLNLADGKQVIEIFQKLSDESRDAIFGSGNPITIDGSELYKVYLEYIDYWNTLISPRADLAIQKENEKIKNDKSYIPNIRSLLLEIGWNMNNYFIKDKDGKSRPKSYVILTQMNTMNVYVLANLVFDFLLFKKNNPLEPYIKLSNDFPSWIEELKNKKSKIINITEACEGVIPNTMSEQLINDASRYINEISIRQTPTQQAMEEQTGEPDIIPFDDLDKYISQFESEKDDKKGGKGKRYRNRHRQKGGNIVYSYNPQDQNTTTLLSIIESQKRAEEVKMGGNRTTKKRRNNKKQRSSKKKRSTNKYR